MKSTEVSEKQIQEWKKQHGTIYMLESDGGRTCYVFDPLSKLVIMKLLMQAMLKGSLDYVDAFITNCWLGGDETMKKDDQIKLGLVDQVKDLVDIPEFNIIYEANKVVILVEGQKCEVRLATRQDIKFAEDKNKSNKPLDTQIYLLERIAISNLDEWRANNRHYMALLLAVNEVKDKKYVSIKKL